MPSCPVCGQELVTAPENATDAFQCEKCGKRLFASIRYRTVILLINSAAAVLLRCATLRFNPNLNPQKTSKLPFAIESLLIRLFWRTRFIEIGVESPYSNPRSDSYSKAM
jgi:DNA-directed RNA polymerase subunit RPC12/RpoP